MARWVLVNPSTKTIVAGPMLWRGPDGEGDLWTSNADGAVWTSNAGTVRTAPADLDQWAPNQAGSMILEARATTLGYSWPAPPPVQDSDGDGVTDDPSIQ